MEATTPGPLDRWGILAGPLEGLRFGLALERVPTPSCERRARALWALRSMDRRETGGRIRVTRRSLDPCLCGTGWTTRTDEDGRGRTTGMARRKIGSPGVPAGSVLLVGNSNVGKSCLFAALTGRYVTVSNYPGTTVEIARGVLRIDGSQRPVIDTPGIRGLVPLSDDERVARDILLAEASPTVIQVVDAKNLRRGLLLTVELAEAGLPLVLAVNMIDEAEARGITIDTADLSRILRVPVVATVAPRRTGIAEVVRALEHARVPSAIPTYDEPIEAALARVAAVLPAGLSSGRCLHLTALAGDETALDRSGVDDGARSVIREARGEAERRLGEPLGHALTRRRLDVVDAIVGRVVDRVSASRPASEVVGRWAVHPIAGWPILGVVLLLVYILVGRLGAGTLVNVLEDGLFGHVVDPWAKHAAESLIRVRVLRDLLVGPYGLITMALTYSVAIVLPIVGTFFLAFGVLEDSGYLPRVAVMLDRAFRRLGLNGKAVLPMVLGLGCVTMATVATRVLETRKERLQVTLLLALGVPCSAQLGVILGMITRAGWVGAAVWTAVVALSLLAVGRVAARVIPGPGSDFVLELPPMRVPTPANVALKTAARIEWYLKEVVPVFVIATAVLFVLDETGLLRGVERVFSPLVVSWLGLPAAATGALLVGFLRRDYAAAGVFALARAGLLTADQVVVALVVITLFVPCIASLLVIIREHGLRIAAAMLLFISVFAALVGGLVNLLLGSFRGPTG